MASKPELHPSPPLVLLASLYAAFFISSLVVQVAVARGSHVPSPFGPAEDAYLWFAAHPEAVRWSSFLQLCAAVPFTLFVVVAVSRLQLLKVRAAGTLIALGGGQLAGAMQVLSAIVLWALAMTSLNESVRALQMLSFAASGTAFVVFQGTLLAGLATAAGMAGLVSPALKWAGMVTALICWLSVFTLVFPPAAYLVALGRILGFVWLIWAGLELPKGKRAATEPVEEEPAVHIPIRAH